MTNNDLRAHLALNPNISPHDIAKLIEPTEAYDDLPAFLVSNSFFKSEREARKFIASTKATKRITEKLGCNPVTTREFLGAVLKAAQFKLDIGSDTPMMWVSPFTGQSRAFEEDRCLLLLLDFNRNLLENRFTKSDLADELSFYMADQLETLRRSMASVLDNPTKRMAEEDVRALIEAIVTDEQDLDLAVAIFKKFIWQVKRKLNGLKVTDHLMPVLYGLQKSGKSELVKRLCAPLGDYFTSANFQRLSDTREVAIFQDFVVFLDEMEKAERADIEAVKNVITRDKFSYRPMGTNARINVAQNATFIGTANKTLGEMIKDPTGNRRFAQIDIERHDFAMVNAFDFTRLWSSVDHLGPDPMVGLEDKLAQHQKAHLVASTLDLFIDHIKASGTTLARVHCPDTGNARPNMVNEEIKLAPMKSLRREALYELYRNHCDALRMKYPLEIEAFTHELNRLAKGDIPFEKAKSNGYMCWRFLGSERLRLAS